MSKPFAVPQFSSHVNAKRICWPRIWTNRWSVLNYNFQEISIIFIFLPQHPSINNREMKPAAFSSLRQSACNLVPKWYAPRTSYMSLGRAATQWSHQVRQPLTAIIFLLLTIYIVLWKNCFHFLAITTKRKE